MENRNILENLIKKKDEEYHKMRNLSKLWFDENISFDKYAELREEYKKHKEKYFFYRGMIEKLKK